MTRVWVNGAFDVLHLGHVRLLEHAASLGKLFVGINSDSSVRALKGSFHPVNDQATRREMLLALRCVDTVITFDEHDPVRAMRINWPIDIVVKGVDYLGRHLIEQAAFPSVDFIFLDTGMSRHGSDLKKHPAFPPYESAYRIEDEFERLGYRTNPHEKTTVTDEFKRQSIPFCSCHQQQSSEPSPKIGHHATTCQWRLWKENK